MLRSYRKIKKQLLERKKEIEKNLDLNNEFGMEIPFASDASSGELSQYDNHPADSGTALYEREKDMVLKAFSHEELQEINDALIKMENGTYGVDETTGKKIPYARLKALPTAKTAVNTSPEQNIAHSRPIEEDVLEEMKRDYNLSSDETEYNEQNAYDIVASFNETSMTYEGSSLIDNEDGLGYVEMVEAIGSTGIEGYQGDDAVQFQRNIQYDQWMNQEDPEEDEE